MEYNLNLRNGVEMDKTTILDAVLRNSEDVLSEIYNCKILAKDHFVDLGACSIDRVAIIDDTLTSLSVDIPLCDLTDAATISDLVDLIYEHVEH